VGLRPRPPSSGRNPRTRRCLLVRLTSWSHRSRLRLLLHARLWHANRTVATASTARLTTGPEDIGVVAANGPGGVAIANTAVDHRPVWRVGRSQEAKCLRWPRQHPSLPPRWQEPLVRTARGSSSGRARLWLGHAASGAVAFGPVPSAPTVVRSIQVRGPASRSRVRFERASVGYWVAVGRQQRPGGGRPCRWPQQ